MEKFGKSQSVLRTEDVRFLTGQGRYVDDIVPANALYGYVFRSSVAHADIVNLDVSEALEAEGVHAVLTAADLDAMGMNIGMKGATVKNRDGSKGAAPLRPILALGRVRFVGEAIAFIVADTLALARDAAELIEFDYTDLPVSADPIPSDALIHPEAPDNIAFDWSMGDEAATQSAFDAAAHHITAKVVDNRIIVNSMEPRGAYAEWDGTRLHVAINAQGVWEHKDQIAHAFKMDPEDIRITNPDVGGGFGMKAMAYPENFLVAAAAKSLGRVVRWMGDRSESMLSDNAGRDLISTCELAFDENHKIQAYRVTTVNNLGAYNSQFGQPIQTELFSKVLMGTYDCTTTFHAVKGIYTNTTQTDAYRGAGRPEAIFALERTMDQAARELGVDPWELRRKNFIPKDAFPYTSATGELYDVGDFDRVLTRVESECDVAGFADRRAKSEASGKLRGLGLCFYIESILGDPSEAVKVEFVEDGTAKIYVGTQSNGQGHETVYATFLSDQSGIPMELIEVVQGDSDRIAKGGGTGGSRSVTVQTHVTLAAVAKIVAQFTPYLAEKMGVDAAQISFDDNQFRADASNLAPTMLEVAEMARVDGRTDLLTFEARAEIPGRSYPNGAHVAEVEIDPETGKTSVVRYTVTDDFGNLISPMLVAGQVHGGVAQGLGQVISEHVVYDAEGQLLSASFMDYGMPRADDMPFVDFTTEPTPSTANPMGMKGCGEAGTVGSMAAVANAVQDALHARGVKQADMPFTPSRVWALLQEAHDKAA
ncbi:xanthine dehydrogenase family protein molybdopterin-binding subunit [Falsihalocynthiibacter sp. CO-5D18]|uniref:xanthine dehydrogenase family protein molybdopterin-binding subunit n=1 Tax=Falsihalocynthiibacter sp. CO-5D18 TaxID=3240872 RepID=UPI00350F8992